MSCLSIVPDTLVEPVAPAAERVIHASPSGVTYTGGTGLQLSVISGSILPSRRCSGVTRGAIGLVHLDRIGSHTLSCHLWWIMASPGFQPSPHQTFGPLWRSYADYVLAVCLHSADASGTKAADSVDHACEAIQVGLRAIVHAAGIALKVHTNLELARHDKAVAYLSFNSDTKAQLHTLPSGHEELFRGKLDEASKQAEEQGHRQRELKVSFGSHLLIPGFWPAFFPVELWLGQEQV